MSGLEHADEPPTPLKVNLRPGRYEICRCGLTREEPFCDGSHAGRGARPMRLEIDEPLRYAWCRCGQSATLPTCDGTHRKFREGGAPSDR